MLNRLKFLRLRGIFQALHSFSTNSGLSLQTSNFTSITETFRVSDPHKVTPVFFSVESFWFKFVCVIPHSTTQLTLPAVILTLHDERKRRIETTAVDAVLLPPLLAAGFNSIRRGISVVDRVLDSNCHLKNLPLPSKIWLTPNCNVVCTAPSKQFVSLQKFPHPIPRSFCAEEFKA